MTMDSRGNSHKAAGRPDGGQFDRKAGQGTDDDLDFEAADARLSQAMPDMDAASRRRLIDAVEGGEDDPFVENGLEGLPDDAKAMARIMAARGGDQVYRDLAEYNKAIGYRPEGSEPSGEPAPAPAASAPSMLAGVALTSETFKGLVSSGMRDFHGADLHGLDLSDYDLKGLNLDGVDLTDANLDKADLSRASLRNARLDGARLTNVRANGIDLTGASVRHADLSHMAIHASANGHVRLVDADLTGSRLDGFAIDLDDDWGDPGDYDDASGIRLADTVGSDVVINLTRVHNADLTDARWDGGEVFVVDEDNSTLAGASFRNMDLFELSGPYEGVDLTGSSIGNTGTSDFSGAILRDATFDRNGCLDRWDDVSFRGADLRGCAFGPSFRLSKDVTELSYDLRGARLEGAMCWDLKGRTGIRTDRDPEGREPFNPAAYGMRAIGE